VSHDILNHLGVILGVHYNILLEAQWDMYDGAPNEGYSNGKVGFLEGVVVLELRWLVDGNVPAEKKHHFFKNCKNTN